VHLLAAREKQHLAATPAGHAQVGLRGLARAIDLAAHDRDSDAYIHPFELFPEEHRQGATARNGNSLQ